VASGIEADVATTASDGGVSDWQAGMASSVQMMTQASEVKVVGRRRLSLDILHLEKSGKAIGEHCSRWSGCSAILVNEAVAYSQFSFSPHGPSWRVNEPILSHDMVQSRLVCRSKGAYTEGALERLG
jgi:hypothetical protein